ncbi:MAG: PEGA domain-containing protein [Myxococcales bacterium]|nr:PEGA domain-containing protein [Myxococcales bacterium]
MKRRSTLLALLLATLVANHALAYPGAPKGPVTEEARAEAKSRVKRALGLFDQGDNAGALAELRKAYELTGSPLVLYNIGLVLDAKGDYPEADAALTEVLALTPDPLKPEARKRAVEAQAHAHANVGTIELAAQLEAPAGTTDDPLTGAQIELDGVEVGRWPLAAPMKVSVGEHTVGLVVAGYAPARKKVLVASGTTVKAGLSLVAMATKAAQLTVKCNVPKAEVLVDGEPIGRTPFVASVSVAPGKHVIEAKRPGYSAGSTVVTLAPGGTGAVDLDVREDAVATEALGAKIKLEVSEVGATVTIDGAPRVVGSPIALPPGLHRLHVERAGFFAVDRDLDVKAGVTTTIRVNLPATPETEQAHDATIKTHRTWGLVGAGVGGALLAGSGVWLGVLLGQRSDINARALAFNGRLGSKDCSTLPAGEVPACVAEKDQIDSDQASNRTKRTFAVVGLVVGAVGLGLGIYSFATAPDPNKYKTVRRDEDDLARLSVVVVPGYAGLSIAGRF